MPHDDVRSILAETIAEHSDLTGTMLRFLSARIRLNEAAAKEKESRAEVKELRQELVEKMAECGLQQLRVKQGQWIDEGDVSGVLLSTKEVVRYGCLAADRPEMLKWAPASMHTLNSGTLNSYCSERVAVGETLPQYITEFKEQRITVRGLPHAR